MNQVPLNNGHPSPTLIIGGAYCGKSDMAIDFLQHNLKTCVVGTADNKDPVFQKRIDALKNMRPDHWRTFEDNENLSEMMSKLCLTHDQILLDSINQWVASRIVNGSSKYSTTQIEEHLFFETDLIIKAIKSSPKTRFFLLSNEVNSGMVPPSSVPQLYRQLLTRINCKFANICQNVTTITAGIPVVIKGPKTTQGQAQ